MKLRPFYHHTDPKVRAHVTLCMLALLLERTLERRLKASGTIRTAATCFEKLEGCHLNLVRSNENLDPEYVMTEPTQDQQAIVRSLRMKALIDPIQIAESLEPRRDR